MIRVLSLWQPWATLCVAPHDLTFLLFLDWQEGGFIYDVEHLAEWCKMTPAAFQRAWERILHRCFVEHDGRMWNPRLERERVKQLAWRAKSSAGGRKGAATRWGKTKPQFAAPDNATFAPDIDKVLAEYVVLHPRRKTSGEGPRRIVRARLADFTPDELIEALKGNAADAWHKERSKHELGYVLRNVDKVNEFRAKYHHQQQPPKMIGVGGEFTTEDVAFIERLGRK